MKRRHGFFVMAEKIRHDKKSHRRFEN